MSILADVVIPVGPYHTEVATEAIASAQAQTIPVNVIQIDDRAGRGKAWARNEGARRGAAPFLIFLDADDLLAPEFAERTLATYQEQTYVYTDWHTHNGVNRFARQDWDIFKVGMFHIITTLLPRAAFEAVGGFDETLPALEDEDLYRKLQAAGICGVRCPEPLVHYRRDLGRGEVNSVYRGTETRDRLVHQMEAVFTQRYGKYRSQINMCATCGGNGTKKVKVVGNEPREGDVLVKCLYPPQYTNGPITNDRYPYVGFGDEIWVNEQDAKERPDLWEIIPKIETPSVEEIRRLAMG